MSGNFFPTGNAKFRAYCLTFKTGIDTMGAAAGLAPLQVATFGARFTVFDELLAQCENNEFRTPVKVDELHIAKRQLTADLRALAGVVQRHPGTTDPMRTQLGLPIYKQPSPQPPIAVSPGVDITDTTGRTITVDVHDKTTKRGKAAGAVAAWVYWFAGETYSQNPGDWEFAGAATRPGYKITLPDSVAPGTMVWLCAAWVSRRQEAGPVSLPVPTRVQFGGVGAKAA
ncbi:MAG TPA: hypothetical protein VGN72_09100 [Tepidisphaeraceae bacterium]|nr:hypothetical protein [Tepidisphaeraceae bacterium]